MDSRKFVLKETALLAAGQAVCVAATVGAFALLGYYDRTVLLGGIAGGVLAVLNFFFMAIGASLAADKAQAQDVAGGQKLLKASMTTRYGALLVLLVICAKSGYFNLIALMVPLVLMRPVLMVVEFFRKSGEKTA